MPCGSRVSQNYLSSVMILYDQLYSLEVVTDPVMGRKSLKLPPYILYFHTQLSLKTETVFYSLVFLGI